MKFASKSLTLLLLAAAVSPGAVFAQRTRQMGDAPKPVPPPEQQQQPQGTPDGKPKVSVPAPPPPPKVVPAKYMGGFASYRKKQEGMLTFDDRNQRIVFRDKSEKEVISISYDAVMVAFPAHGVVSFATLSPSNVLSPEFGALLVVAIAGFVGFEATVVLSEEAKDPRRTIGRATHWAVILPGLLCGLSAWAMSVRTGPDRIVAAAQEHKADLVFALGGSRARLLPDFRRARGPVRRGLRDR